jgi:AraC-like DNA-binding protein
MFTPTVAVRLYRPVALALEARGIAAYALFAEFGMPDPGSAGWDVRMPLPQIAGIWDRLLAATGDAHFALHAAEHVDLTTCDVITYLEANATTVRTALLKKFEYLPLMTNAIAWTLETSGSDALLALHERPPRPPLAPVAEYLLAARHVFLKRFGPPTWQLRRVSFRHPAPADTSQHVRTFGVLPRFAAAQDQLDFDAALLDAPMRQRDDALADLLDRYAEQALSTVPATESFGGRVRELLRAGNDPGIAQVARKLGLSTRSLQRALSSEGTSYLEISSQARRAIAERLLGRGELAISEIAYALGFRDVPAFHKAFQRWTGSTPGEFRAHKLQGSHLEPAFGRLTQLVGPIPREHASLENGTRH